tara:strand:- start:274 stop:423 length:150 start_codon:yes stop_codon:yes gene_type:complete
MDKELSSFAKRFARLDLMAQQVVLMKLQAETNNKLLTIQNKIIKLGKDE